MVFGLVPRAACRPDRGSAPRNREALQHPAELEPQIPVASAGVVQMDDERAAERRRTADTWVQRRRARWCARCLVLASYDESFCELFGKSKLLGYDCSHGSTRYRNRHDFVRFGVDPRQTVHGDRVGGVSFNLIHKKCKGRIKQQMFCPTDNEVVERTDLVKGYEYAKNQYVLFTEEELDALEAAKTNSLEIVEFVPASTVDWIYISKTYYLGPDKGGDKAYKLLAEAMERTGKIAVGRYWTRGKEQLVLAAALQERAHAPLRVLRQRGARVRRGRYRGDGHFQAGRGRAGRQADRAARPFPSSRPTSIATSTSSA